MRWSYRVARVAGTDVKLHFTFVLLVAYYVYVGWVRAGADGAVQMGLFLGGLFLCILLHEFGHILMAGRFGVPTPDVILLPIGGVARLQRMPEEPRQEFLIALAGPAVTLLIVLALAGFLLVRGDAPSLDLQNPVRGSYTQALLNINAWLLLFNMLPAFPMDGGRVLRAALAHRLGLPRATRIAAKVGQGLAIVMAVIGLTQNEFLLTIIAAFVFLGASGEVIAVQTRAAGKGVRVAQMMVTDFRTVPIYATLAQASDLLLSTEQRDFPVLDNLGHVEGMLTRDGLVRVLAERGPNATVAEAMTAGPPQVAPTLTFEEALEILRSSGLPSLPVVDAGRLVGLLTADNISDLLLLRRARGEA